MRRQECNINAQVETLTLYQSNERDNAYSLIIITHNEYERDEALEADKRHTSKQSKPFQYNRSKRYLCCTASIECECVRVRYVCECAPVD